MPESWATSTASFPLDMQSLLPCDPLRSLAGTLNFVAQVCPAGRAFERRNYDAVRDGVRGWRGVDVVRGLRDELQWWREVLGGRWDGMRLLGHGRTVEM